MHGRVRGPVYASACLRDALGCHHRMQSQNTARPSRGEARDSRWIARSRSCLPAVARDARPRHWRPRSPRLASRKGAVTNDSSFPISRDRRASAHVPPRDARGSQGPSEATGRSDHHGGDLPGRWALRRRVATASGRRTAFQICPRSTGVRCAGYHASPAQGSRQWSCVGSCFTSKEMTHGNQPIRPVFVSHRVFEWSRLRSRHIQGDRKDAGR